MSRGDEHVVLLGPTFRCDDTAQPRHGIGGHGRLVNHDEHQSLAPAVEQEHARSKFVVLAGETVHREDGTEDLYVCPPGPRVEPGRGHRP